MTEADKIVAAIFAANLCSGKNCDRTTYLQTYDDFINLMKEREKEKHKTPPITDKCSSVPPSLGDARFNNKYSRLSSAADDGERPVRINVPCFERGHVTVNSPECTNFVTSISSEIEFFVMSLAPMLAS